MMAADCLEALGIKRGDYVIKVNNRKVLDGVMEAIGLGGAENAGRRLTVLRAIDKLDRLGPRGRARAARRGPQGRERRLHQGRGASSAAGDRALCGSPDIRTALAPRTTRATLIRAGGGGRRFARLGEGRLVERTCGEIAGACRTRRSAMARIESCVDPSVVRGLEYYTGPVFEAELTFETPRRGRQADPLRLGRRRRALRRAGGALSRRAGSGDRLFDRHLAPAGGAAGDRQPDRRRGAKPGPVVVARARPRPHGRLPAPRRELARGGDRRRNLSRRERPQRPAQIRRPARQPVRRHPGLERARRAGRPRRSSIRDLRLGAELAKASKDRADYLELRQKAQFAAPEAERWSRGCAKCCRAPLKRSLLGSRAWNSAGRASAGARLRTELRPAAIAAVERATVRAEAMRWNGQSILRPRQADGLAEALRRAKRLREC